MKLAYLIVACVLVYAALYYSINWFANSLLETGYVISEHL